MRKSEKIPHSLDMEELRFRAGVAAKHLAKDASAKVDIKWTDEDNAQIRVDLGSGNIVTANVALALEHVQITVDFPDHLQWAVPLATQKIRSEFTKWFEE